MKRIAASITGLLICLLGTASADIIYFKDGMRTVCHGKAWIENDEVKCDYDGVILTYRREDVDHIHETFHPEEDSPPPVPASPPAETISHKPQNRAPDVNAVSSGVAFYDPRRPYKYWSSPSAKHHSYREAIDALAKEFDQSPQWVEKHIGETNDLERIRKNLSSPAKATEATEAVAAPPAPLPPTHELFYNPRREYKYQISADKKFHTYREAIDALASEFQVSPDWVETHMGQENDVFTIRQNLSRQKSNATE
jgi:hypothetical protein